MTSIPKPSASIYNVSSTTEANDLTGVIRTNSTSSYDLGNLTTQYMYGMDKEHLSQEWQIIMGFIYLFSGIIGTVANGFLAYKMKNSPPFRNRSRVTLHLSHAVANAGIVGGFPLTAPSCFAERWLLGSFGCQLYGFSGMFFGISSIFHLMFISIDIYFHRKDQHPTIPQRRYIRDVFLAWTGGLIAAMMPLMGWASYDEEPSKHSCTLDWKKVDGGYVSYLFFITITCYVIPFGLMCYCHFMTMIGNKFEFPSSSDSEDTYYEITEAKISKFYRVATVYCLVLWSPYAILCINSLFSNPNNVPVLLSSFPALIIKIGSCLMPVVFLGYIYSCKGLCDVNQVAVNNHERSD